MDNYFFKYFHSPGQFFKGYLLPFTKTRFYRATGLKRGKAGAISEIERGIPLRFKVGDWKLYPEGEIPPSEVCRPCIRYIFTYGDRDEI